MISEAMVYLAQSVHLSCTETNTVSKWIETIFHLSLVTYLASKMVQTVDLSCTETNTISKWTETIFYMTHVT
jgi:hypothetical protein